MLCRFPSYWGLPFVIVTLDSLFVGPDLIEDTEKPGEFYSWFGNYLKTELKPKAVVCISAHWQGRGSNGIFGNISISEACHLPRKMRNCFFQLTCPRNRN